MTKAELAKYAGIRFYNLSTRPGGMYATIHCLTLYEVTERGTCKYLCELIHCVANKAQYEHMRWYVGDCGYHYGRPTAENLTAEFLDKQ